MILKIITITALFISLTVILPAYAQTNSAYQINATQPEIAYHSQPLLKHYSENFDDDTSDDLTFNYVIGVTAKVPQTLFNGVSDNHYKIQINSIRGPGSYGAITHGGAFTPSIHPSTTDFTLDVLGKNLRGPGSEKSAGATVGYGIEYELDGGEKKSFFVRTHTTNNKPTTTITYVTLPNTPLGPTAGNNDLTPVNTWGTFTGNVKDMYEDSGLGTYSDVLSWKLYLGGASYTSQLNRYNSWTGLYDNIEITPPVDVFDIYDIQESLDKILEILAQDASFTIHVTHTLPDNINASLTQHALAADEDFSTTLSTPNNPISAIILEFETPPTSTVYVKITTSEGDYNLELDGSIKTHTITFSKPITYQQAEIAVETTTVANTLYVGLMP